MKDVFLGWLRYISYRCHDPAVITGVSLPQPEVKVHCATTEILTKVTRKGQMRPLPREDGFDLIPVCPMVEFDSCMYYSSAFPLLLPDGEHGSGSQALLFLTSASDE